MIEITPTVSDTRPPQMIREKMSRPRLSVPNQCAELAGHFRHDDTLLGFCSGSTGASTASSTTRATHADAIQKPRPSRFLTASDGDLVRVEDVQALELADVAVGDAAGAGDLGGHGSRLEEVVLGEVVGTGAWLSPGNQAMARAWRILGSMTA